MRNISLLGPVRFAAQGFFRRSVTLSQGSARLGGEFFPVAPVPAPFCFSAPPGFPRRGGRRPKGAKGAREGARAVRRQRRSAVGAPGRRPRAATRGVLLFG